MKKRKVKLVLLVAAELARKSNGENYLIGKLYGNVDDGSNYATRAMELQANLSSSVIGFCG